MGTFRFHVRALACAAALSAPAVLAAPIVSSVSGTVGQGQTITISGSAFGTKPQAAPIVFDDFENGTGRVEGKPAVQGSWGSGDWSYAVSYSTTQPLQGSKVAYHAFNSTDYNASLYVDPANIPAIYMDFWMRAVPKSSSLTRNFKPWRVYGPNDASTANDVVFCDSPGWVGLESGGGGWIQRARVWNQWEHYQIAIKFGSNGLFTQHRDGIADLIRLGITAGGDPQGVRIGHYWATSADGNCPTNPGADVYTDLVYVDNTLARVVLGDQPVFDASRVMAIQIPSAWSSNQITAKVNTARFASGSTAYVFVVDANNVASPGFRVTVGQGSVTPNPPTDVSAN